MYLCCVLSGDIPVAEDCTAHSDTVCSNPCTSGYTWSSTGYEPCKYNHFFSTLWKPKSACRVKLLYEFYKSVLLNSWSLIFLPYRDISEPPWKNSKRIEFVNNNFTESHIMIKRCKAKKFSERTKEVFWYCFKYLQQKW